MAQLFDYDVGLALVLPERVKWDPAFGSYTQRNEVAGVPVPQNGSGLVVRASGDAPSEELAVRTQRGGLAGLDAGATLVWRPVSEDDWYGHEAPHAVHDYRVVPRPSFIELMTVGDVLSLSDGAMLYAVRMLFEAIVVGRYRVTVHRYEPDGTLTTAVVWQTDDNPGTLAGVGLVQLGNGRVLCLSEYTDSTANLRQVRCDYSDDGGRTWASAADAVLPSALSSASGDNVIARLSATSVDNTIVMVLSLQRIAAAVTTYRDVVVQYASRDGGSSFAEVYRTDEASSIVGIKQMAACDVEVTPAGLILAMWIGETGRPYRRLLGDPYDPIGAQAPTVVDTLLLASPTGALIGSIGLTVCALATMRSGVMYAAVSVAETYDESVRLLRSDDGGVTWKAASIGVGGFGIFWRGGTSQIPTLVRMCELAGRLVVTQGGPDGLTVYAISQFLLLGKPSTVTLPPYYGASLSTEQVTWIRSWWGDGPDTWPHITESTTGGTGTFTDEGWQIDTSSAAYRYDEDLTADAAGALEVMQRGLIRRYVVGVTSGSSLITDQAAVRITVDDGSSRFDVSIRHVPSGYIVWDNIASALVGSEVAGVGGAQIEVMVAMQAGSWRIWYRLHTFDGERPWIKSHDFDSTAGSGVALATVRWGHIASTSTAVSVWRWAGSAHGNWVGTQIPDPYVNPRDLHGRSWPSRPAVLESTGVSVRAQGVTVRGDEWRIKPDSDVRFVNALVGGPRRAWESEDTTEQELWFELADGDTHTTTDHLVVSGFGSNVGYIQIIGRTASGTETTLFDGSLSEGMTGLRHTWGRNAVRPATDAASDNEPTFAARELAGCQFAAYAASSWRTRKIANNRAGKWTDAVTARTALYFDGTYAGGTADDGIIIPKDWAVQVSMRGAEYRWIKIVIPAPNTTTRPAPAEGYWRIGRLHIGYGVAFPQPTSFGERVTHERLEEVVESRDIQRTGLELAPTRRRIRTGFVDGTITYQLRNGATAGRIDADPPYFKVDASGQGSGLLGYELLTLDGLMMATRGAVECVWLPEFNPGQTWVHNRRDTIALVYLDSDTAHERFAGRFSVHGDAMRGDAVELVEAT